MVRPIFDNDIWAKDVAADPDELLRPTSLEIGAGWPEAQYPTREWENWAKWIVFSACQWIEEKGVFEWDANITYAQYALVQSAGIHYISLQGTNLNQTPASQPTYWQNYYDWLIYQAGQTMVVADEASLGTGVYDGQIRATVDNRLYTWDLGATKWGGRAGNNYATTPAFGNVIFEAGTIISIAGANWRWNGASFEEVGQVIVGQLERPEFQAVVSSTQLNIAGTAGYHLYGIGWVWWNGTLAYNFTTLAASTWSYLYIDYSSVSVPGPITASNLIDSTTAPTYDSTKGGWYNGDDRCVFMVYGLGVSSYKQFIHDSDKYIQYEERFTDVSNVAVVTGGTSYGLTIPAIVRKAMTTFQSLYVSAQATIKWRVAGSTSDGHVASRATATSTDGVNQALVSTSSGQQINIFATANGCNATIFTDGFYLPKGM